MEKRTVGIIATIVAVIVGGIPGLFTVFAGNITPLVSSVMGSIDVPNLALTSGLGSCCICIPIPLAIGVFALYQRAKGSGVEEQLPPSSSD